jgi:hypothetical protein
LASLAGAFAAQAGSLETLLMPGEVVAGHAKIEQQCEKCHEPFSQSVQNKLCLDCHKETAKDVEGSKGFHGRIHNLEQRQCKSCHTDHKGRKARIVNLDKASFDHAHTDFLLKGRHGQAECGSCHKSGKPFREAPSLCVDCHKDDQPHHGKLGEKCADCHDENGWKKAKFDHDKTHFPLTARHKDVACQNCHADQRYKETPKECFACHQINDVHNRGLGEKCDKCHNTNRWKEEKFNHDRDTKFRLTGHHAQVKCDGCHRNNAFEVKLGSTCISCHKKDDEHKGKNGTRCESCHVTDTWTKSTFDHDKTHFPLRESHAKVACEGCHKSAVFEEKLKTGCVACHKKDDVHKTQEGEICERCHTEKGWRIKVTFSHELTKFPLMGLHTAVPCAECHLTASFQDAETKCVACHKADDIHKKAMGGECQSCHNPNGWRLWNFDHTKRTHFPLEGAHEKLACAACHKDPVDQKIELAKDCFSCHKKDDAHKGTYGVNCERCHSPTAFGALRSNLR